MALFAWWRRRTVVKPQAEQFEAREQPSASPLSNLVTVNGVIYGTTEDSNYGPQLWRTDGTTAGTTLFKDINVGATGSVLFLRRRRMS